MSQFYNESVFSMNGNSNRLYIFEHAIDCLSNAILENFMQGNTEAYTADYLLEVQMILPSLTY